MVNLQKKSFWQQYGNLILILSGILIGALIGVVAPNFGTTIKPIGDIFLNLLFTIVVPLVFVSIASAVGSMANMKRLGRILGGTIGTFIFTGAIAGVVGFLLVSGANNTLYSGVAAGAGFTAITVAWLAQLNPFAMVGISALLAVLQKGADTLNTQMGIPASLSDVITGVLLFFMLGCEFFINYKLVFRGAEERHKRKEAAK